MYPPAHQPGLSRRSLIGSAAAFLSGCRSGRSANGPLTLRNVSYDPTRAFYVDYNRWFTSLWSKQNHRALEVEQSHGGSGKQARSVIDGLETDVVTLALGYDIDAIASKAGLLPANWQSRLPHNSCPYTSTIVFLVRAGNPKSIHDWPDLIRPDVKVISPNPKTSGGARWNYLAAWGAAMRRSNGDEAAAEHFVGDFYRNVPVLDSGARGATTTFVQRQLGDVLVSWENEARLAAREFPAERLEVVMPSVSIRAEPPVALVDKLVDQRGTRAAAQAYLEQLYSLPGQRLAARHDFRPSDTAAGQGIDQGPELFTLEQYFGTWAAAHSKHFKDKGIFDRIYRPT